MEDRESEILHAAWRTFLRYGVKRTSMMDIAEEAGVSRQTVYNFFDNKNDVLSALIRFSTAKFIEEIKAALPDTPDLGGQLDLVFEKMVLEPFDMLHASPNAADILEGFNLIASEALAESSQNYVQLIAKILEPYAAELKSSGYTIEAMAEFIQVTAYSSKKVARDRAHLEGVLATIRSLALSAAGRAAA